MTGGQQQPAKRSAARALGRFFGSLASQTAVQFRAGVRGDASGQPTTRTKPISHTTEERTTTDELGRTVVLRRTTIDEISVTEPPPQTHPSPHPRPHPEQTP